MKIKTSELTLLALDWAVAQAEGDRVFRPRLGRPDDWDGAAYRAGDTSDERWIVRAQVPNVGWFADYAYNPSTSWHQAGPIIEREKIGTLWEARHVWSASTKWDDPTKVFYGKTKLIAAMRCYVASKLGDEVEVPEELL